MRIRTKAVLVGLLMAGLGGGAMAAAGEHVAKLRELADQKLRAVLLDASVIEAVKAQNARHAALGQSQIDSLDQQWRAETKGSVRPLIDGVLGTSLSGRLKQVKEASGGVYTELFVMDAKGLNVASSDMTSDYWQGDEAKWQQTFLVGPDAIHVSDVEQDESTQEFQAQVSLPVVDPATGEVIGAATFGVNVDAVMY